MAAVDRISPEAPVPVVRVTREEERIGGAANVAFNVTTLGAHCSALWAWSATTSPAASSKP
jgi:bifunctional ADP-heptose synthase (sugar kinase/adenylyltransferase)